MGRRGGGTDGGPAPPRNEAFNTLLFEATTLAREGERSLSCRLMTLEGLQALADARPTRLPAVAR